MKKMNFSLKPFKRENSLLHFSLTGRISRDMERLTIIYELSGTIKKLIVPPLSHTPERMDRLWEATCFELFLNPIDSDTYWEFNLSPSGNWNVYRFNAYRMGMKEELTFNILPFSVQSYPDILQLELEFDLENLISSGQAINIGICAVTRFVDTKTYYWALTHHGSKPDFHRRDSFIIEL
jgi:hypothetical protein